MDDASPPPGIIAAPGSGGIGLLFNATASVMASITLSPGSPPATPVAALALFPPSQAHGISPMSGCSFAIPPDGSFQITIGFDTGQRVTGSFQANSEAAPALFLVGFLNGLVAADPGGRATDITFTRALAAHLVAF